MECIFRLAFGLVGASMRSEAIPDMPVGGLGVVGDICWWCHSCGKQLCVMENVLKAAEK